MKCKHCGEAIKKPKRKCYLCNPYDYPKSMHHAKKAMAVYPEKVRTIYECRCQSRFKKKNRHHYNYNNPFDVMLLCDSCHRMEHGRLKHLGIIAFQK